ncbi:hypothetical protein F2P81_012391 [Scophthalmus maximus]|uniref:Polyhomeotic-like protein 2 n=1 Tax=Scophthalmus maximus TaxID=52904 RepID=A0A6A4SKG8_SCOMX|nr:hypothetical protein F2P81_012391 [Scophthalmus maximus]
MESEPGAPASAASGTGTATSSTSSSSATTTTTAASSSSTSNTTATTSTASTSSNTSNISSSSSSNTTSTTTGRQTVPQISVYSGIPDRQTVQVFQQALHRQPNTAAQYLQQMYAAQQQHLMLQTAALQQQHNLSTAQLQSLAAVQQASIAAGRQSSSQNGTSSQQTGSTQATAQQNNLVQVARSLGRAVPLSPQLIFTPTATVTAVQSESSTQASSQNQVQNLAIRGQQGATSSSSQTQTLQALSLKQSPVPIQPTSLVKNPSQGTQVASAGKTSSSSDGSSDGGKKGDGAAVTEVRAINMSRHVTTLSAQPLIAPAYTQIQPQSLVQQHKQHQQQFMVHQGQGSHQKTTGHLLQTASIQPSQHPVPVLPKPAPHHQASTPSQQATIFHSTISPHHALHSSLSHAKAQPVQLTAINLQIQPTQQPAPLPSHPAKPVEQPKVDTVPPAVQPQEQLQ